MRLVYRWAIMTCKRLVKIVLVFLKTYFFNSLSTQMVNNFIGTFSDLQLVSTTLFHNQQISFSNPAHPC